MDGLRVRGLLRYGVSPGGPRAYRFGCRRATRSGRWPGRTSPRTSSARNPQVRGDIHSKRASGTSATTANPIRCRSRYSPSASSGAWYSSDSLSSAYRLAGLRLKVRRKLRGFVRKNRIHPRGLAGMVRLVGPVQAARWVAAGLRGEEMVRVPRARTRSCPSHEAPIAGCSGRCSAGFTSSTL